MSAFLVSTFAVAIAEIGDKTQLLALFLALRFHNKLAIVAGIFFATLINHWLSAFLGVWISQWISPFWLQIGLAASFVILGLWLLIPDKDDSPEQIDHRWGAFVITFLLFMWAEMGDKTQIATVVLAAKFDTLFWVVLGSTLGMMLANVPVVYYGEKVMRWLPMALAHRIAAALFIVLGLASLVPLFWPS